MLATPKKIKKLNIGDKVVIESVSNASLNLYMKARQNGLSYIRCPCNAKHTSVFEVQNTFLNGFLLKSQDKLVTVAFNGDLRRVG